uniref:NADH-ubiquinone oxidoreductase chain 1 n=1 Tax=Oncopodura yosiiana TaxID=2581075 RepID=A0A6H0EVT6_9HEXA|nr:NADH dehydrogenase subunit 1 [Oncopodura yosiiana]QIT06431.1 NADH dehydrogenase subunit 1 [Oncopodura yosiiana]
MVYLSLFLSYLFLLIGVMIGVAFMILLERKVLGYIQIRKGPNKVGYMGIFQSFGDAIKLFIKEQTLPSLSNLIFYYFSPVLSLFIVLFLWCMLPLESYMLSFKLGGLFFFCCTSFGVYTLMSSGWSSNSNYALLGSIRGIAQTISYEVSMFLIFLSLIFLVCSLNLVDFGNFQYMIWNFFIFFPLFLCWFTSNFAETNRTPFDFSEGESELVSGFNIEYGSGGFALLFLGEYTSIIFMSFLLVFLFTDFSKNFILICLFSMLMCFTFIWVRGTLPRFRYDKLMYLAWKCFLPISLNLLFFYLIFSLLVYNFF